MMSKYQKIDKIDGIYILQSYKKPLRIKICDLEKENEQLKKELKQKEEDHELLIDDFQEERESLCKQIKQEFNARKRAVEKIKTLRHEICEKITFYLRENLKPIPNKKGCFAEINREELFEFLDQIEQGDE